MDEDREYFLNEKLSKIDLAISELQSIRKSVTQELSAYEENYVKSLEWIEDCVAIFDITTNSYSVPKYQLTLSDNVPKVYRKISLAPEVFIFTEYVMKSTSYGSTSNNNSITITKIYSENCIEFKKFLNKVKFKSLKCNENSFAKWENCFNRYKEEEKLWETISNLVA